MRVAVLLEERCKPNSNAFAYLKKYSEMCERECIQVEGSKCKILETACPVCFTRAKHCPDGAVKIINLPEELDTDLTHSYGENAFRLFRLPSPRQEQIVGILGPNGIGKSTAINLLSGTFRPNLGDWENSSPDWDEVISTFPRGELRDYLGMVSTGEVSIAVKPQYIDKLPRIFDGEVRELLARVDDRGEIEYYTELMGISHILVRKLGDLSGGELQRVAICATLLKEADVYFFDEPSSYLDIYERMRMVGVVRELAEKGKRVLVVEHDLAILDVLCDLIHVIYGERSAYGIFTPPRSTRTAINAYLDGFLPEENVRIRDKPIQFLRGRNRGEEVGTANPKMGRHREDSRRIQPDHRKGRGEVRRSRWSSWSQCHRKDNPGEDNCRRDRSRRRLVHHGCQGILQTSARPCRLRWNRTRMARYGDRRKMAKWRIPYPSN